jgi:hypothetical protein
MDWRITFIFGIWVGYGLRILVESIYSRGRDEEFERYLRTEYGEKQGK